MAAAVEFVAYGGPHLAALGVILVTALGLSLAVRRHPGAARPVCRALAAVLVANLVFEQAWSYRVGLWSARQSLPLHLCDLALLLVVGLLWGVRSPVVRQLGFELAYFWGLGGTVQALLTPDVSGAFPQPLFWTYFIAHGGIVVAVGLLTVGLRLRPRPDSVPRVWLCTAGLAVIVAGVDAALDANYMFLCGPPSSATLLSLLGSWPLPFLAGLAGVAWVGMCVCYLPYGWIDLRNSSRTHEPC